MLTTRPVRTLLIAVVLAAIPLTGMAEGLSAAGANVGPLAAVATPAGVGISVGVVGPGGPPAPSAVSTVPFGNTASLAEVTLTIRDLKPLSLVEAYVHSTPVLFATGHAEATGVAVLKARLPEGIAPGDHKITINGTSVAGLAFSTTVLSFTVTADGILQAQTPVSGYGAKAPATATSVGTGNVTAVTQTIVSGAAAEAAALGNDPFSLGGVLMVSGVTTHTVLTAAPGGGDTVLEFTLKNTSAYTVTSSLRFWLQNALGIPIAEVSGIAVTDQASGETRTVAVTIGEVGQYGIYNAFVTLTPPGVVMGTTLSPLTRDAPMFVLPIFLLILFAVGGGLFFGIRHTIRRRHRAKEAAAHEADAALGFDSDELAQEVLV